jgi:hypothetical protein
MAHGNWELGVEVLKYAGGRGGGDMVNPDASGCSFHYHTPDQPCPVVTENRTKVNLAVVLETRSEATARISQPIPEEEAEETYDEASKRQMDEEIAALDPNLSTTERNREITRIRHNDSSRRSKYTARNQ